MFWDVLLFNVDFGLVEDCEDYVVAVVLGEAFVGPLEQWFVEDWEEDFWAGAAEWS